MSRCNCSEQVESEIEESEVYIRLFPVGHKKLFFSRIIQGSLSSISFTKPTLILLHHDEAGYLWRSFKWIKLADVGHYDLGSAEDSNKRQINSIHSTVQLGGFLFLFLLSGDLMPITFNAFLKISMLLAVNVENYPMFQ